MPAPIPARFPLAVSSAFASSTSCRASRLVCSESCFTSSAIDASEARPSCVTSAIDPLLSLLVLLDQLVVGQPYAIGTHCSEYPVCLGLIAAQHPGFRREVGTKWDGPGWQVGRFGPRCYK